MGTSLETEHIIGPLGSSFYRIKVPSVMREAINWDFDWNKLGKRVMIDAKAGIISWMSPSTTHSITTEDTRMIVMMAAGKAQKLVRPVGDNRWRPPNADRKIEADASFYIGATAERYYTAIRDVEDEDEAEKVFCQQNPPDLVVEIEITNQDADKPGMYADLGVREMWQINRSKRQGRKLATILDLMAEGGPREIEASLVLPGLKITTLPQAFHLARHGLFQALQALLEKELVVPVSKKTQTQTT